MQITNTTNARSTGFISLSVSPDLNGYYRFIIFSTEKLLKRHKFQILPVTDDAIQHVHELAMIKKQPFIISDCPIIEWRPNVMIETYDDDVGGTHT